jgi:hypothetical protein
MTKKALLDACTIFGMPIKDTLVTAAFQGVFQLYLSVEILDEVSRNRIKKQLSTPEREDHFQILDKLRINRCNKFADRLYRTIGDRYSL